MGGFVGGGGTIGSVEGTGAGEGALDSTTIEKCPCWNVEHLLPETKLLKLTRPCKSNQTHFAVDPSGTDFTSGNIIDMGEPVAKISNSGKYFAERFEAS
ncbi:hypothetical protein RJ640_010384 [Escallonia rubra]|uniref:Uncharacterized protein n=1 Tax=Escallonia rubra TaxID=112253 RepID=A0AA88R639_9ASTE|nr:hypothetical protein RJ640_010384 [Escallonia rubra]